MRILGIIFILVGVCIGFVWPWAQLNFEGEEIASVDFVQFSQNAVHKNTILLKRSDNPVRIRFVAKYSVGGKLPPVKIPIEVKLSDKDGTLIGAIISFPTSGRDTGPDRPSIQSGTNLTFKVQNDGLHKLQLAFAPNRNNGNITTPDVDTITATFVANASEVNQNYKIPAAILALLGFYLFIRARRGRSDTPSKQRWGRGGS